MKILHTVESYYPSIGGMQEVVKRLSEGLASKGHEVTIATSFHKDRNFTELNKVNVEQFFIKGNSVRGIEAEDTEISKFKKLVINEEFDIVVNFAAQQWATDLCLKELDNIPAIKIAVPTGFSGLYNPMYANYFEQMKSLALKYDHTIFLSNDYRDINFLKEAGLKKYSIIPNGASIEEFENTSFVDIKEKYKIPRDFKIILHVGSHTGVKGHSETIKIFNKAKINNAYLVIIGNEYEKSGCGDLCKKSAAKFNKRNKNKILILSTSRIDTVNFYKQSDLFLFPSNIECSPIVLFEAMASKLPFLVTDVGNSKEIIKWSNKAGILLPTKHKRGYSYANINKSSKILSNLITDNKELTKLSSNGYKSWKKKFTWEKITDNYEKLYMDLLRKRNDS